MSHDAFDSYCKQKAIYDQACLLNGRHFTEYSQTVKQLTRAGRLQEAEKLLLAILATVERAAKIPIPDPLRPTSEPYYHPVPPGWYRHLAVLYRKQKRYADEVALIERYLRQPGAGVGYDTVAERLDEAKVLKAKAEGAQRAADLSP